MVAPADSSIPTKDLSIDPFFLHFFPFIIDNYSYGSLFSKCIKINICFSTFYNSLSKN